MRRSRFQSFRNGAYVGSWVACLGILSGCVGQSDGNATASAAAEQANVAPPWVVSVEIPSDGDGYVYNRYCIGARLSDYSVLLEQRCLVNEFGFHQRTGAAKVIFLGVKAGDTTPHAFIDARQIHVQNDDHRGRGFAVVGISIPEEFKSALLPLSRENTPLVGSEDVDLVEDAELLTALRSADDPRGTLVETRIERVYDDKHPEAIFSKTQLHALRIGKVVYGGEDPGRSAPLYLDQKRSKLSEPWIWGVATPQGDACWYANCGWREFLPITRAARKWILERVATVESAPRVEARVASAYPGDPYNTYTGPKSHPFEIPVYGDFAVVHQRYQNDVLGRPIADYLACKQSDGSVKTVQYTDKMRFEFTPCDRDNPKACAKWDERVTFKPAKFGKLLYQQSYPFGSAADPVPQAIQFCETARPAKQIGAFSVRFPFNVDEDPLRGSPVSEQFLITGGNGQSRMVQYFENKVQSYDVTAAVNNADPSNIWLSCNSYQGKVFSLVENQHPKADDITARGDWPLCAGD